MTGQTGPVTLDVIRAERDPGRRSALVATYLERLAEHGRQARALRHEAIDRLIGAGLGATEVARRAEVSISTVKARPAWSGRPNPQARRPPAGHR